MEDPCASQFPGHGSTASEPPIDDAALAEVETVPNNLLLREERIQEPSESPQVEHLHYRERRVRAQAFSFSGKDFTFSFSVPDGTEQLQVTFEEDSTDDDGPVDVTLTVQGPIHDDVSLGAVLSGR